MDGWIGAALFGLFLVAVTADLLMVAWLYERLFPSGKRQRERRRRGR